MTAEGVAGSSGFLDMGICVGNTEAGNRSEWIGGRRIRPWLGSCTKTVAEKKMHIFFKIQISKRL